MIDALLLLGGSHRGLRRVQHRRLVDRNVILWLLTPSVSAAGSYLLFEFVPGAAG